MSTNMTDEDESYENSNEKSFLNSNNNSNDNIYRAKRVRIEFSSSVDDPFDKNDQEPSNKIVQPTANLAQSDEDVGYRPLSPLINSVQNNNTASNRTSNDDETDGFSDNIMHSYVFQRYFPRQYHQKHQSYASVTLNQSIVNIENKPSNTSNDHQSVVLKQNQDESVKTHVHQIYGIDDDIDLLSSASSEDFSNDDFECPSNQNASTSISTTFVNSKPIQRITIREHCPAKEISSFSVPSASTSLPKRSDGDHQNQQIIRSHLELQHDPNPKIIKTPNPHRVTYKQNVSIRYLNPPTPPPRQVIVREILPPCPPTPPPLIINEQSGVEPRTPSPEIIREAPPTPPPVRQQAKIITKVLPQQAASSQRVVFENNPQLPAKPQSIIIEKWLPYKPQPPREVIYERVIETPMICQFQPGLIQQTNPCMELDNAKSSIFNQVAWQTQQQLEALERQTLEQQQQPMATCMQMAPPTLTTSTLIVNYPPVTRTINANELCEEERQYLFCQPIFMCPTY